MGWGWRECAASGAGVPTVTHPDVPSLNRQDSSHCSLGGCPHSQRLKDGAVASSEKHFSPHACISRGDGSSSRARNHLPSNEELWEQSQAYQAVEPQLPFSRAHAEWALENGTASLRRQPGQNQLGYWRLGIPFPLVREDLCPQASQVFTRQRG